MGKCDAVGEGEALCVAETDTDGSADLDALADAVACALGDTDGNGYSALQANDSVASMLSAAAVPTM